MAYGDFKDLTRRIASYKIFHDKVFNIAKNLKHDGCQLGLISLVYKLKTSGKTTKNENISNKELSEELHNPIMRTFEKRKVHSPFTDYIWDADLAEMQLISKFNEGICFSLCVFLLRDILSKYARIIPLKDKRGYTITSTFQKNLKEANRKKTKCG